MAVYKRYHKEDSVSYTLGITVTFELLLSKASYVNKVYVHSAMKQGATLNKLLSVCKNAKIDIVYTDKIFNVLSKKENCYVIGEFRKFSSGLDNSKSHIVLVNPSDAGNMGTILRSALGFGLNQIAVIRKAVDIFDPKTIRASMGAVFSSKYEYFDSFDEYLVKYGYRELYPFMLDAKISLHDLKPGEKFSLIFGNEASGLPKEFSSVGTSVVIPHSSGIDSLNLPIAASIAMYEATKAKYYDNNYENIWKGRI